MKKMLFFGIVLILNSTVSFCQTLRIKTTTVLESMPPLPPTLNEAYLKAERRNSVDLTGNTEYYNNYKKTLEGYQKTDKNKPEEQSDEEQSIKPMASPELIKFGQDFAAELDTNEALREKIDKMSEKEQAKYMQDLMAKRGVGSSKKDPGPGKVQNIQEETEYTMQLAAISQKLSVQSLQYRDLLEGKDFDQHIAEINLRENNAIQALPIVNLGELGKGPDPDLVDAIHEKSFNERYALADKEYQKKVQKFNQYKKESISILNEFDKKLEEKDYGTKLKEPMFISGVSKTQKGVFKILQENIVFPAEKIVVWGADWQMQKLRFASRVVTKRKIKS